MNLLLTPVDIALVPLFVYIGEALLGREHVNFSPSALMASLGTSLLGGIAEYGAALGAAVLAWILL